MTALAQLAELKEAGRQWIYQIDKYGKINTEDSQSSKDLEAVLRRILEDRWPHKTP